MSFRPFTSREDALNEGSTEEHSYSVERCCADECDEQCLREELYTKGLIPSADLLLRGASVGEATTN